MTNSVPWYVRALLVRTPEIMRNLDRIRASGTLEEIPTPWQLSLVVLRMWHRLLFHRDSIGTSPHGVVRPSLRARLLAVRALRLPVAVAHRAVSPLDFTGLASEPERVIRHLVGAHHDGKQFAFDLEILATHGCIDELIEATRAIVDGEDPRAEFFRDLTVFADYHEKLYAAAQEFKSGHRILNDQESKNPDLSFVACMKWCARAPTTPVATLAAWWNGQFSFEGMAPE